MSIRNLDEAEAAVRELLALGDPRAALRKMPALIASCIDPEARSLLEGAQSKFGEMAGTRVIRKPVVIPPDPDSQPVLRRETRDEPPPAPARPPAPDSPPAEDAAPVFVADPYSDAPPEPAFIPKPEPKPPEPAAAEAKTEPAPAAARPAVPKLKPFSDKSKPKPAAGGPVLRTNDPSLIAAELLSAEDPDAKPLPAFTSRKEQRTEVVTLLGEEDIIDDEAGGKATAERKAGSVRRRRPPEAPAPEPEAPVPHDGPPVKPAASLSEMAAELGQPAATEEDLPAGETLPEGAMLAPPTRVIPRPAENEPPAPAEAPPEAAKADPPQVLTREQARELPADLLNQLGAAETLQPDTLMASDVPLREPPPAAPIEPVPLPVPEPVDDDDVDDDDDDDDDDIMELGEAAIMEAGSPPTADAAGASPVDMQDLLASLPPMPADDDDDDDDVLELGEAAILTMPDDAAPAIVATPIPDGERDPEEMFDSIELALRTGALPLEAGREGLSDDEAGSLFQAFLSTNEEAARAADPSQVGEDTIVMDKRESAPAPAVTPGAGAGLDAVSLYRVIRRIFDETHQKLPTWLIARTIMREPGEVYQLVLDALQLRQARDFIGYKETVADLFQRILATRLKHGKDIEAVEKWLRREVLPAAPAGDHERLESGIDGVLISDRRLAEARGYKEHGGEGIRAALSLLAALAHGGDA